MQTEPHAWEAARFKESPGLLWARLGSQEPRQIARPCQVIVPKWRFRPQVSWRNSWSWCGHGSGSAEAVTSLQRASTWTFPVMVTCPREASGPQVAHWPRLGVRLNTASFHGREWHSAPALGSWDLCVKWGTRFFVCLFVFKEINFYLKEDYSPQLLLRTLYKQPA